MGRSGTIISGKDEWSTGVHQLGPELWGWNQRKDTAPRTVEPGAREENGGLAQAAEGSRGHSTSGLRALWMV